MSALSPGKRSVEICGSLQDVSSCVASHGGGSGIYSLGRKTPQLKGWELLWGRRGEGSCSLHGGPKGMHIGTVERARQLQRGTGARDGIKKNSTDLRGRSWMVAGKTALGLLGQGLVEVDFQGQGLWKPV